MSIGTSNLAGMPQGHREKLENCVKLLLLWVAASDGKLEESELELVSAQFPDREGTITNDEFLAVIRSSDLGSIEKAIRVLAAESRELRTAFIDMAVAMSMADKDIAIDENHILRFYADALHLGVEALEKRFRAISGVPLPEPGDTSDPEWWEASSENHPDSGDEHPTTEKPTTTMSIGQARNLLGVSLNATQADIEQAYENLANIFQVNRVEAMGEAAVSVAHSRFEKIQQAYWLLKH
jgi:DnaJ-domain-containing protein 1